MHFQNALVPSYFGHPSLPSKDRDVIAHDAYTTRSSQPERPNGILKYEFRKIIARAQLTALQMQPHKFRQKSKKGGNTS
jgi:hypothetical protein